MTSAQEPPGWWRASFGVVSSITGALSDAFSQVASKGMSESPESPKSTARSKTEPKAIGSRALGDKMQTLLQRALEQSSASGQAELFNRILDQIVPDEARIISALSDGSSSPLVSVHALNRAGLLGEALIDNASLVGRVANVALPRLTPTYVGHLINLGLAEIGPEDDSLKDDYQILLADTDVLKAIRAGSIGPVPARVERRTLRLSALGHALWNASTEGAS